MSHLIADPLVGQHAPLLVRAARTIGGPAVRNMATIGGNIRTASPAGDSLPPLYLLGAEVELASRQGRRRLPIGEFVAGPGRTLLHNREIITRILLPHAEHFPLPDIREGRPAQVPGRGRNQLCRNGEAFLPTAWWRRPVLPGGAWRRRLSGCPDWRRSLVGSRLDTDTIREAAEIVRNGVSPIDDIRATADYRRSVAANLLVRFLEGIHA